MATPQEIENTRQSENLKRQLAIGYSENQASGLNFISPSIPDNQKPKGNSKLISLITSKSQDLITKINPAFLQIAGLLGIRGFGTAQQTIPDVCPPQEIIDKALNIRNNIVGQLNNVSKFIERSSGRLEDLLGVINAQIEVIRTSKITKNVLNNTQRVTSAAAAAAGIPVPGPVSALLSNLLSGVISLDNVIKNIQFDDSGNPKLPASLSNLNGGLFALTYLDNIVQNIIQKLNSIDQLLAKCGAQLDPLDSNLQLIANNENDNLYKGFLLKIEEIKFNDRLTQKLAVAYNTSGIALLKTDPSFTDTPQTLIDTLKFIIDRDNLKAN
jgi:hypothetical protein